MTLVHYILLKKRLTLNKLILEPGLVTVVIPAYSASKSIHKTVKSAIDQTYAPKCIVIAVNGQDETIVEALKIRETYSQISICVLYPLTHVLTASENWTRASQSSSTKYTKLLCADDVLHPSILEEQVKFLEDNSNCSFVGSSRMVKQSNGTVIFKKIGGLLLTKVNSYQRTRLACTLSGTNVLGEPSAILFRTETLKANLPWDESNPYVLDLEMYLRLLKSENTCAGFIPKPLCDFIVHSKSWSKELHRSQSEDFISLLADNWKMARFSRTSVLIVRIISRVNQFVRKVIYTRLT